MSHRGTDVKAQNHSSGAKPGLFVGSLTLTLAIAALAAYFIFPATGGSATPGLVAAFAFDEGSGTNVADASGSGNNGTAANTTWATTGKYGKALNFNGTSSRVTIPDSASLHLTNAMTLEAWVYPTSTTNSWRDVVYKGNDNYYLMATSTPSSRPAGGGIMGGSYGEAFGTGALAANSWAYLTVTYDGANLRLYLNGTQVSSLAKTGSILTSTNPLTIGSDPIYGQYFRGMIDEARVYNTALTPAQIQTDMTTPITPQAPDTQAPSAPGTLSATAISSGRIDLSWGAATDNVAVTGYRIERCQGAGCTSFTQIAAPTGTATSYSDTTTAASTSYSYRVRATDAAPNLGPYTNTATATTPNASGPTPVAAFAFDDGSGTNVADTSGSGNSGTAANATWTTTGKYGKALTFNGTSSRVTVPNSSSLQLTTAMTLEAWVNPTAISTAWRDVIYKGNDNYYLMGTTDQGGFPGGGGTFGGANMNAFATSTLPTNTWSYLATTYDGANLRLYVNGTQVATLAKTGAITTSTNPLTIGSDPIYGQYFEGTIDEVRVYSTALTAAQIQADMTTPITPATPDPTPPTVTLTSPAAGASVSDIVTVGASAADNVGVAGVQFYIDGAAAGVEDATEPYTYVWDTRSTTNGAHTLTARARDAAGNSTTSAAVSVNVGNTSSFQNEVLATGLNLPTSMVFLPDGRMLVTELPGTIKVLSPPYTTASATPFLQLTNVGNDGYAGLQQGIFSIALDPGFATNHHYYIFYTARTPNRDRLSRFTADATLTTTSLSTEVVLYQDPQDANTEHHGGAVMFGNDGKLYFTTGDHFQGAPSQDLTSPRGKIHRINPDGSVPTDNPFYDGAGPNVDSIWALGLRNPYRAYYDAPSGRMYIGDVGGNDPATAKEEINVGAPGANYGWPNSEGPCTSPCKSPLHWYAHNGRDASVTGGFVYHGTQFPSSYQGSYFFADYAQNWIKRLTFDGAGNVNSVVNFEPLDGTPDGPYGDIVYLTEGPDGAVYYIDLGYSDTSGTFGVSKIRRIRYQSNNLAPTAQLGATPTSGPAPLTVSFSSAGSVDPEGQPLTFAWSFGDGTTSTAPNPTHIYNVAGPYTVRLSVSDGVNTTVSTPKTISVGGLPTPTILAPTDGAKFRAGDVISFSGDATDPVDGSLPASAYTWTVDFLHDGHVHPGAAQTGIKSGTLTIPTSGHDFSGNTRYRVTLTVRNSIGLTATTSVTIFPDKVNLSFATVPAGLTLYLDGIAKVTPFVYDTLIGFNHTIEARNQTSGGTTYTFGSWSDGGGQQHTITVPGTNRSYTASYNAATTPATPAFVQVASSTPQTSQTTVATAFGQAQTAGNLNVVVIGWNNATSNITSVTDSRGNAYQIAAPITRSGVISQAIYYARNIAAGATTVTVAFNAATPYVDVRIAEYSGLDPTNPLDVTSSGGANNAQPNSGAVTTTTPRELVVGAGTTTGSFTGAGSGYTTRIITVPDADILEDRVVTSAGSYSATAAMTSSTWVMQLVTFRAAGQ